MIVKQSNERGIDMAAARLAGVAEAFARIELDRFCDSCGYNLRTLPVERDPRTGIPIVRCTECGKFLPANDASTAVRPWLRRMSAVLLGLWILTLASAFFFAAFGEGAISYNTLEELTISGGFKVQVSGNTTKYVWTGNSGPRQIREELPDRELFIAAVSVGSFAAAMTIGAFVVVLIPHWRRTSYLLLIICLQTSVAALVAFGWYVDVPHLMVWGLKYIFLHCAVQIAGGIAGVVFGRAIARLTVRVFLPPSVRPRLAYLWLVDNKSLPKM